MLHEHILCYVILCYIVLYYIILYYIILSRAIVTSFQTGVGTNRIFTEGSQIPYIFTYLFKCLHVATLCNMSQHVVTLV